MPARTSSATPGSATSNGAAPRSTASRASLGALLGSTLGKAIDGQKLLFLFALLMIVVGVLMVRGRGREGDPGAECNRENAPKVLGFGGVTGAFSGFFGIGGGFLIVPGLIASTGMPILNAIGSSLVAVTAFGLTTALNYAFSGLVDWPLAFVFVGGGIAGGVLGAFVARWLAGQQRRPQPRIRGPHFRRRAVHALQKRGGLRLIPRTET